MKLRYRFLTGSALSAPLIACVLSGPVLAQPVQGIYVAGEGGATFNQDQRVRSSSMFPDGRDRWRTGVTGIGSIGYGLGNGFRVEVEGDYRNMDYERFVTNSVQTRADGRRQTYGVMANALFDLDIGKSWLFPYFGAGVGYGWTAMNTSVTAAGNTLSQHVGGTFGNFAYQGIFGLSFPVPWVVGLSATAEYRFWTMLGPQSHGSTAWGTIGGRDVAKQYSFSSGNRDTVTDFNHSLMLGLRYEFNPAPPPPPPAPPEVSAPSPAAARTYLVFFDWDKAALSERARSIVAVAAQASAHTALTRIEVSGYTDNSAARPGQTGERYNMGLSLRRADAVKAELVRDGVAGTIIGVNGYGQAHQLVVTGPDTREPQNRRVEIVFR
ncbi:OmpA family protein [Acetobacter oeni]|uniref:Membrane protein n=1 Tax=Acetobacter oeni TaxID=304077 RepID=A0A511XGM5_9PROT|nr:OmpA family protein [Acetobacter oeni]MBB3881722.1 outer membrane protein OmpA-like peptidoglycan-associated protein [Acetobacter oeni]NHO17473.1 OmpA family protein [Acetobacter oeni]GBR01847.1 outer membrane protein [Acetobacter oeni LMG 21952]GEN62107.1 membrane protein [Acetobacter oeni]